MSLWGVFWLILFPALAIRSLIGGFLNKDIFLGFGMFIFFVFLSLFISSEAFYFLKSIWVKEPPTGKIASPNDIVKLYHGGYVKRSTYEWIKQKETAPLKTLLTVLGFLLLCILVGEYPLIFFIVVALIILLWLFG